VPGDDISKSAKVRARASPLRPLDDLCGGAASASLSSRSENVTMAGYQVDLGGRTVLVTGASSGLGVVFARALAASGARVVLAARRVDRLEAVRAEIVAAGGQAVAVAMDVADEASTIAAYDAAEAAFGPVDSVIANAGVSTEGPALDLTMAAFDQLMDINVRGVFLTAREGARRMIAAGAPDRQHGRIVIVSSITANYIAPGLPVYSATKAAVLQMGKVLARDWARRGVGVNMILPGYIETELNDDFFATDAGARFIAKFPRRRLLAADDLLPTLLYLASDASRAVTGAAFTIDDGQSL
jgi:NAD(P)-dependent dehydrogenase (short-subunit alcohol dehydrogenase family)